MISNKAKQHKKIFGRMAFVEAQRGKKSLCYFNNMEAKNAIERKQNDHTRRQKTVLEKNKIEKNKYCCEIHNEKLSSKRPPLF